MSWRSAIFGVTIAISMGAGIAPAETGPRTTLSTTRQAPDEFGTQDYSVTVIYAGSFAPQRNFADYPLWGFGLDSFSFAFQNPSGGCLSPGNVGNLYATAGIPSGVVIDFIGLQTYTGVFAAWGVDLVLLDRNNAHTVVGSVNSTVHGWDTDYNVTPLGFQLTRNVHNALLVHVQQAGTDQSCSDAFAWVEIWWHRTVSPAPATATFPDVPTDHPFFQFVEALYAAGITAGYGNGNFGVNDPISRGQMAVFLAKALGLHWPY